MKEAFASFLLKKYNKYCVKDWQQTTEQEYTKSHFFFNGKKF